MSNASVAVQILPLDSEEKKTLEVVDQVIAYIQSRTDDYEEVMDILKEVIKIAGETHPDIFSNIKIRYKGEGQVLTTDEKTKKYRQ